MDTAQDIRDTLQIDEIAVIGRTGEKEGKPYHLAGLVRYGREFSLCVLELAESVDACACLSLKDRTRREEMKYILDHRACGYFEKAAAIKTKNREWKVKSAVIGSWEDADPALLEMKQAGWKLPEDSIFLQKDSGKILRIEISFADEIDKLPDWSNTRLSVVWRNDFIEYPVEKPVHLTIGGEQAIEFSIEEGKRGVCYINSITLMDVWKEREEGFLDPAYLEYMTEQELKDLKKTFFEALSQNCPKGKCYIVIEYECTIEGSVQFYSREYLESRPQVQKGGMSMIGVVSKPKEPVGRHGFKQHGCVIQEPPFDAGIKEVDAELFLFLEKIPEQEEYL